MLGAMATASSSQDGPTRECRAGSTARPPCTSRASEPATSSSADLCNTASRCSSPPPPPPLLRQPLPRLPLRELPPRLARPAGVRLRGASFVPRFPPRSRLVACCPSSSAYGSLTPSLPPLTAQCVRACAGCAHGAAGVRWQRRNSACYERFPVLVFGLSTSSGASPGGSPDLVFFCSALLFRRLQLWFSSTRTLPSGTFLCLMKRSSTLSPQP